MTSRISSILTFKEGVNKRGEKIFLTRLKAYYYTSKYIIAVNPERWKELGKTKEGWGIYLNLINVGYKNKETVLVLYPEGKYTIIYVDEYRHSHGWKWGSEYFFFEDLTEKAKELGAEILMKDRGSSHGGGQEQGYVLIAVETEKLKDFVPLFTVSVRDNLREDGKQYMVYVKVDDKELKVKLEEFVDIDEEVSFE